MMACAVGVPTAPGAEAACAAGGRSPLHAGTNATSRSQECFTSTPFPNARRILSRYEGYGGNSMTYTILLFVFLAASLQQTPALLFVSNELGRTITVIDLDTRRPIADIAVQGRPRGIAVSGDGRRVYIALSDTLRQKAGPADGIVAIDIAARRIVDRLPAGTDPEQFAISRDGHWIYASN